MPPRHLNVILITMAISLLCYFTHRRTRSAILVGDALNLIDAYYVDPVDRRELVTAAMNGLTAGLDEHTEYISNDAYQSFQDSIQQEFAGIGIYVEPSPDDGPVRVVTPLVGSPALEAGLLPGDEIIEVDGEDVSSMNLRDVSMRLKGPIGTTVMLTLKRSISGQDEEPASEEVKVSVQRGRIEIESIVGDYRGEQNEWMFRLKDDPDIAYIRLTSFGEKTVDELRFILKELNNDFSALILDLRANGGGLLDAAVDVSDMFLNAGNIVSTRTRGGVIEDTFDATPGTLVDISKPVAILIDGTSASASEIVSAALQDNQRATIVGTRSYGKGTVQNILPLQLGRSALRLTVARYYRPSGENIHRGKDAKGEDDWGVSPDAGAVVELEPESMQRIAKRWREAAYPSLIGIPMPSLELPESSSETSVSEVSGESVQSAEKPTDSDDETPEIIPTLSTGLSIDPQLRRALDLIRKQLLDQQANPQKSDKVAA